MKVKIATTSVAMAGICFSLSSFAANVNTNNACSASCRLGSLEKASKVIGMEVRDADGMKVGKVRDLAVDLQNGRITEVVVSRGAKWSPNEQLIAVPAGSLQCDMAHRALQMNFAKDRFDNAKTFTMAEWNGNFDQQNISANYSYYGAHPYFASNFPAPASASAPEHLSEVQRANLTNDMTGNLALGKVERASQVIGEPVENLQNQRIGKVENLMIDLQAARVTEVIVATGGFLGMGDQYSAVPPQALHCAGADTHMFTMDTTREAMANNPHFNSHQWAANNDYQSVGKVYTSYNVQPYFTTNADNTAQNVADRDNNSITPLNQGTSKADMDITRTIRKQIIASQGLSVNAKNVKIITQDGHVTLRGPVKSEDEKRRIEEIAAQVATQANVDDQIQIQNNAQTTSNSNQ